MLEILRQIGDTNGGQKSTLEVVVGVHAGVNLILDPSDYTIGSTPDANIVLRDAGVEPLHAALRIGRSGARIQAIGGDVGLDDGQIVPRGYGAKLRLPATLCCGEARLRLSRVENGHGEGRTVVASLADAFAERPLLVGGGAAGSVLVVALLASSLLTSSPGTDPTAIKSRVGGLDNQTKQVAVTSREVGSAAEELSKHLRAAGLNSLSVTSADKRVSVSGSLTTREGPAWIAAQHWFEDKYLGRIVLTATVAIGEARSMPTALRLQAIWFGERPYVITEDGLRLYQNAFLNNGWTIQEISENRVLLSKDGETMALTYR